MYHSKNPVDVPPVDVNPEGTARRKRVVRRLLLTSGTLMIAALVIAGISLAEPAFGLGAYISLYATPFPSPAYREYALPSKPVTPTPAPVGSPVPSSTATVTPAFTPSPTPEPTIEPTPTVSPIPIPTRTYGDRTCYLTFDDGPSKLTSQILDTLRDKGVRATFFVIGVNIDGRESVLRRARDEGHIIVNHSNTHNAEVIYASEENLLADIAACNARITEALGSPPPPIFRFPRGSSNVAARPYHDAVKAAGYAYFDWNVLNGDAEGTGKKTEEELLERLMSTQDAVSKKKEIIVLMHDTGSKINTANTLSRAIDFLMAQGYAFETLDKKLAGAVNAVTPPPTIPAFVTPPAVVGTEAPPVVFAP